MNRLNLFLTSAVLLSVPGWGTAGPRFATRADLVLVDQPFNWSDGYQAPSMAQSLALTKGVYQGVHRSFSTLIDPNRKDWVGFGARMALFGIDSVFAYLPFGQSWVHEEWHRAVMSRQGVASYNGVYDFAIGSDVIPVRKVRDDDLVRLKRDHPADFVRLSSAGMESERELILAIESDLFFDQSPVWMGSLLMFAHLSPIGYMDHCTSKAADRETRKANEKETHTAARDFTGFDCIAWVYDLFRPDEPYEARGAHPSGEGIDRYRTYEGLTDDERAYLRRARDLSWLNLIDPFLFNVDRFGADGDAVNVTVRHHLTASGDALSLNLFIDRTPFDALVIFHAYRNREHTFPGLEARLVRWAIAIGGIDLALSPRVMVWRQPRDQRFNAAKGTTGWLTALRVEEPSARWSPFAEFEAKSAGWVAGSVYLDANFSTRAGVSLRLD